HGRSLQNVVALEAVHLEPVTAAPHNVCNNVGSWRSKILFEKLELGLAVISCEEARPLRRSLASWRHGDACSGGGAKSEVRREPDHIRASVSRNRNERVAD